MELESRTSNLILHQVIYFSVLRGFLNLAGNRQFDRSKQRMYRIVQKRDRVAQKHFFAALSDRTKGRDRDTMKAFRRRRGAVQVQSFQWLNRPILTNCLGNALRQFLSVSLISILLPLLLLGNQF